MVNIKRLAAGISLGLPAWWENRVRRLHDSNHHRQTQGHCWFAELARDIIDDQ